MKIKLNLIPEYLKQEVKKARSFKFALKQGGELIVLIIFLSVAVLSFQWILRMEQRLAEDSLNYDSKKGEFEKIKEYDKTFEEANKMLSNYEKIQKDQLHWSFLLRELIPMTPQGIILNGIITKNFKIIISGESLERSTLITFKENLEKNDCFQNVDLPLSNLVSRNNIDFQIDLDLKENCLKQK